MPNQVNEDELQKAIDDITRNATGGVEGSASDFANPAPAPVSPAAAPSMPPIMGSRNEYSGVKAGRAGCECGK